MKLVYIFYCFLFSAPLTSQNLTVIVSGLRNAKGSIRLAVYTDQETFDKEKPLTSKSISKNSAKNGIVVVTFEGLKAGTYGIAMLDDENGNTKMDYGLVMPKEGYGFADFYHTGMSRPKYSDFDFYYDGKSKTVQIKARYL